MNDVPTITSRPVAPRARRMSFGELLALRILLRKTGENLTEAINVIDTKPKANIAALREIIKIAQNNLGSAQELAKGTES